MITAAIALVTSLIGPILGGGTVGTVIAFLATPGGMALKVAAKELLKAANKPLTPAQKQYLKWYHNEMRNRTPF